MSGQLRKIYLLLICLSVTAISCDDLLETKPKSEVPMELVLSNITGVEAMITSAYNDLQPREYYGRDFIIVPEILADNIQSLTRYPGQNNNNPGSHIATWGYYRTINKLNVAIATLDEGLIGTEVQRQKAKGQALFLRALCYFDIARVYAYNPNHIPAGREDLGVPVRTKATKDPTDVEYPSRGTTVEPYIQIEKDLLLAETLLEDNVGEPVLATQAASQALLSRVYLYWSKWQASADYATRVINAVISKTSSQKVATLATKEGYLQMFFEDVNPESIFELNYESNESLGSDALSYIYKLYRVGNGDVGYGDLVPTVDMLAQYETGDVRKNLIQSYTTAGGLVRLYTNKFPNGKGSRFNTYLDNVEVIRLSEMYLNRAEANAELGNEGDAQADLNVIHKRAGLLEIFPTGPALLQAILKERRVELAFEGHRWFDLTRRGLDIPKSTVIKFDDYRILAPIPVNETDVNKNLKQNFNY